MDRLTDAPQARSQLFTPLTIRGVRFRNRVFMSPMCQYSSVDGLPTDWHLVHMGSRAVGGVGLVVVEATAVVPEGRITPFDMGLWSDAHAEALAPIVAFLKAHGAVPGIQIAHAGRKASTDAPWRGGKPLPPESGGWQPVAPSAIPFGPDSPRPRELTGPEIAAIPALFTDAAERARDAGFQVVEIHMAHGYLLHEFLSPLSNHRTDGYGGPFENRVRLPLAVARAVRAVWPDDLPVFVRISATDWTDDGWDLDQSIRFAAALKELGVDLIDCSSGGLLPSAVVPASPGYQVPFAQAIRHRTGILTGAVGLITQAHQAEEIVRSGSADAVFLGRELLRSPYWALDAAGKLGAEVDWPPQYLRARL